jgi:hypothetical protein
LEKRHTLSPLWLAFDDGMLMVWNGVGHFDDESTLEFRDKEIIT